MLKLNRNLQSLHHGGDLNSAVTQYNIAHENWLDLSTGVSPWAWPYPKPINDIVTKLDDAVWQALPPTDNSMLYETAAEYYDCDRDNILVSPGSQLLIRLLPQLIVSSKELNGNRNNKVAIPLIGYQEHAQSWALAGFELVIYNNAHELDSIIENQGADHAVIINPNNPSNEKFSPALIQKWLTKLPGLLVVDEAFMDLTPAFSAVTLLKNNANNANNGTEPCLISHNQKLLILKSVGKFFGLAGIRVGFLITKNNNLKEHLNAIIRPWPVSHSSLALANQALKDKVWHKQQRVRIAEQQAKTKALLNTVCQQHLSAFRLHSAGLFTTIIGDHDELVALHQRLAANAIWTRFSGKTPKFIPCETSASAWLRFSLPGDNIKQLCESLTIL